MLLLCNVVASKFVNLPCSANQGIQPSSAKLVHVLCNNVPNIGPFLQQMCIEQTDLYLAVARGLGEGIQTCQKLFENERWNCTPKGDPVRSGLLGYVMARGECK